MPKISVIVPVYNGEKYLSACLDSLLNQTLRDIEILAVNNGSIDKSGMILAEYAKRDQRIKILTLEKNQGSAGGRNVAFNVVTGKYIAFCDCDDFVPAQAYQVLYKLARKESADIAVGNYCEVYNDHSLEINVDQLGVDTCLLWGGTLWNKIYKRDFLQKYDLKIPEYQEGEDTVFLAQIYDKHPSIVFDKSDVYHHHHYPTQKTANFTADSFVAHVSARIAANKIMSQYQMPGIEQINFVGVRWLVRFWNSLSPLEREETFPMLQQLIEEHQWDIYKNQLRMILKFDIEDFIRTDFATYKSSVLDCYFKFSVVIPVYNTEKYVESTINSVVDQTIGFRENIQIILVNNATQDNSGEICQKYKDMYPNNIIYVQLEKNAGPAGAREIGKQYAIGKYINFLDSDDKWDKNAFTRAWFFLEAHPEVDFAACRVRHFDAQNKWHGLDYKFQSSGIIDIRENSDYVQLHLCSCFVRTDITKKLEFKVDLHHAEDARYLTELLLHKPQYGIIKEAVFYYRTRGDNTSTVQNVTTSREWYFVTPVEVYQWAINKARYCCPEVATYMQYLAAYELQWRLYRKMPKDFSMKERERYRELLRNLLKDINDTVIFRLRNITNRQKINMLYFKYGKDFHAHIHTFNGILFGYGIDFREVAAPDILTLELMELSGNVLKLSGCVWLPFIQELYKLCIIDEQGNEYPVQELYEATRQDDNVIVYDVMQKYCFAVKIVLQHRTSFYFAISTATGIYPVMFSNGRRFPLTRSLAHSHCCRGGWHFHLQGYNIIVLRRTFLLDLKKQLGLWIELFQKKKRIALLFHIMLYFRSFLPKCREIWVFSDRAAFAGDNGEAFFHYVNKARNRKIKTYFSISADSPDYKRLKKQGRVISNETLKFKFLYLRADKVISSSYDRQCLAPLGVHEEFLKDLVIHKQIYLQHGVIKDDIRNDNSKIVTANSGFITSANKEYESLLTLPYGYTDQEIWLTGLARYDSVYNCKKSFGKLLMIAPTWRDYFSFRQWGKDGILDDCPELLETEFFRFYTDLINNEKLLRVMRIYGYQGKFQLHPTMEHFTHYFTGNDVFTVEAAHLDYRDRIESVALLVTDYSSIAFDYAYVYRPCIYAQFDREAFIAGHTYKPGYFDYERDGFGPVCYDLASTVEEIIAQIERGCEMQDPYRQRAEEFFPFRDGRCCERIYKKILEMG